MSSDLLSLGAELRTITNKSKMVTASKIIDSLKSDLRMVARMGISTTRLDLRKYYSGGHNYSTEVIKLLNEQDISAAVDGKWLKISWD